MEQKERTKINIFSFENYTTVLIILIPIIFLILFGIPSPVLAEGLKRKMKPKVSETLCEVAGNEKFRTLYQTFDFRRVKPEVKQQFLKKLEKYDGKDFQDFLFEIFQGNIHINMDKEKIRFITDIQNVYKPILKIFPNNNPNKWIPIVDKSILSHPQNLARSTIHFPITTTVVSAKVLSFCGGFINPLQLPELINSGRKIFKVLTSLGDQVIDKGKENEKKKEKTLPLPGPLSNPIIFVSIITYIVISKIIDILRGNKAPGDKGTGLPDLGRIFFPPPPPPPIKTWSEFITENIQSSLIFLVKNPQYLIILSLIFIYRQKIQKVIFDKNYRDEFSQLAFDTIKRQQEALQKAAAESIKRIEELSGRLFHKVEDLHVLNYDRLQKYEKQIDKSRETEEQLRQNGHLRDLALNTNRHHLETCKKEYGQLHTFAENMVNKIKTTDVGANLHFVVPGNNVQQLAFEAPNLLDEPGKLNTEKNKNVMPSNFNFMFGP
jgi:hypothetical protein